MSTSESDLPSAARAANAAVTDIAAVPVLLLAALTAVGQFASNIYLPALPLVGGDLHASANALAATYAGFLLAFGSAQLVFGPASDRHGRRPVVIAGLVLFTLATVACMLAQSVELLIGARVAQGASAAAAIVVGRAVARDLYDGAALARVMATITIAFALVPGLTPLAGGVLTDRFGWRATFVATLAAGVLLLAWVLRRLPETRTPAQPTPLRSGVLRGYVALLRDRPYLRFALAASLIMGAMAAFFGGSPHVFIDLLGVSPTEYGLYPPLAVSGFVIGGLVSRRAAGVIPLDRLCARAFAILALGAALLVIPPLLGLLHKHAINIAMIVFVSGLGVLLPNAVTGAMSRAGRHAGAAAAMLGFLQMLSAAAGVAVAAVLQSIAPASGFQLAMTAFTALSAIAFAGFAERRIRPELRA